MLTTRLSPIDRGGGTMRSPQIQTSDVSSPETSDFIVEDVDDDEADDDGADDDDDGSTRTPS